jgi:hypothetical protein
VVSSYVKKSQIPIQPIDRSHVRISPAQLFGAIRLYLGPCYATYADLYTTRSVDVALAAVVSSIAGAVRLGRMAKGAAACLGRRAKGVAA